MFGGSPFGVAAFGASSGSGVPGAGSMRRGMVVLQVMRRSTVRPATGTMRKGS